MRVSNMSGSINHECTRYGKYPPAVGISLLKIDVRALQYVFCGIIHFEGKTELLGQTPCSALSHRHRKVRCFVADADGFGSHAQSLDGRVYLASKQDVRLLDTSPCDQIFGELGKGSCERDGGPIVSTFIAHVSLR